METKMLVKNIVMLKSFLERKIHISNDALDKIDLKLDTQIDGNILSVILNLNFSLEKNDIKEFECDLVFVGLFEKEGEGNIDMTKFGEINGAAIVYPYIREHLSYLSLKSQVGNILLPAVNFVNQSYKKE